MREFDFDSEQKGISRLGAWLYVDELLHRTLNDYTVMLSIVRHAALGISKDSPGSALDEVASRLHASAATFRALSPPRSHSLRSLDLALRDLCDAIAHSALEERPITLCMVSQPVTVNSYRCWQISLIVAELVTNAVRHAFSRGDSGSIEVDLRLQNGNIQCTVSDDGISDAIVSPGRGTAIVDALVSELDGTISRTFSSVGSVVTLLFPALELSSNGHP